MKTVFGLLTLAASAWAQQYLISTVAGGAPPPTTLPAVSASIGSPQGIATDGSGNVYFASLNCVFKVDRAGTLTRIAGTSRIGFSGDGGPATSAQLFNPGAVATDSVGNVFVVDWGNIRVRKISSSGIITTVAGTGTPGVSLSGGPAATTQIYPVGGIALDSKGNLYMSDYGNVRVWKLSPSGVITPFAGNGTLGYSGDGGPATNAQFSEPAAIAVDPSGNVYVADTGNFCIRKIALDGTIRTIAGTGMSGYSTDGGAAVNAPLSNIDGLATDSSGNLFFGDLFHGYSYRTREISASGIITTVTATNNAQIFGVGGLAIDPTGNLFLSDSVNSRLWEVSGAGALSPLAGNGTVSDSGDGGPATLAQIAFSQGNNIVTDPAGNIYFADQQNNCVRRVTPDGIITTIVGGSAAATTTALYNPAGVAIDRGGNLYIADSGDNRIVRLSSDGVITLVAGDGTPGDSGDGGLAILAQLHQPTSVVTDTLGNLIIADYANHRVRKVSSDGSISTLAGTGAPGYSGDGGLAVNAKLNYPAGLALDGIGNLYIADSSNSRVRRVDGNGMITTVAGKGLAGHSGDGGPAAAAQIYIPFGIAFDNGGDLFIGDGTAIRMVSASGIISTVAGATFPPVPAYTGDGGDSTRAGVYTPYGVAVNASQEVLFADSGNNAIRKLTPTNRTAQIDAVLDAASESALPLAPGKIVVIYGSGLGPPVGVTAAPSNGKFGTTLSGTSVNFNDVPAPVYYASATQIDAIVPYEVAGATTAVVTVSYQGGISSAISLPVQASSPGLFSYNATGAGQAAAINVADGSLNTAANPVKIGQYISFYLTGEGQTTPAGIDGKLATLPLPTPNLPVRCTVGGLPAVVQYKGAVYGAVAGLMQVNVQIPSGVTPGGYVPVVLTVGNASTVNGAMWIAVSN